MNLLHPDHSTPARRSSASSRRRSFLGLGATIAALGLAGCGFELRKAPVFAFRTIAVPGNSNIVRMLRRSLPLGGNVQVLPPEQASEADAVLDILAENQERGVLSTNSSGQVRELQLRLKVSFRLVAPRTGKVLLPPTEIVQTRDISFNETAALAKEGEEQLLFRDMQNDIVQQMLRRLAAVKEL